MTASELDIALRVLFDEHVGDGLSGHMRRGDPSTSRFLIRYTDMQSGWLLARDFARKRKDFPLILTGGDRWIFRAYMYNLGQRDEVISEARALATQPRLQHIADTLRAALISPNVTLEDVQRYTGMDPDVILAFEKLFFGIFDRLRDRVYVKDMIYPKGRMEEMMDNYAENESFGKMLMRIGFTKGIDVAMYVAGLTGGSVLRDGDTATRLAEQLESMILASGLLAAHAGLIHQAKNSMALQHAKTLIAASKQGGQDTPNQSPIATNDKNDPLLSQLHVFLDVEKRQRNTTKAARLQLIEVAGYTDGE